MDLVQPYIPILTKVITVKEGEDDLVERLNIITSEQVLGDNGSISFPFYLQLIISDDIDFEGDLDFEKFKELTTNYPEGIFYEIRLAYIIK